jgi:hypothetical protein
MESCFANNINQAEKYFKKAIELGIVYGYGFGCSQIESWELRCQEEES